MKHILVTGGSGFIGSHIVSYHLERGDHVWAVDNLQSGRLTNLAPYRSMEAFRFDQADIRDWQKLQKAVQWSDRIYHVAASIGQRLVLGNPSETLSNNIHGCEKILQAMCHTEKETRLIITSTSGVYCHCEGDADGTFREDAMLNFPSGQFLQESYPLSKLINEIMALSYVHEKGLHCTMARLFNAIGTNQNSLYGMVVPTFIEQALQQVPLTVFGNGLQKRCFSDVRDTVSALNSLLECAEGNGQVVNVGSEHECSIIDLAKMIINATRSSSTICHISYDEAYGVNFKKVYGLDFKDVAWRRPNLKKLSRLTGFQPKYSLEQTIQDIVSMSMSVKK